jgi:xanthine dehydrogenase/oxidase
MDPKEIIESVFIPFMRENEFLLPFKQARRREDDISIVTSGMRVHLAIKDDQWNIEDCSLAFGGMAPLTKSASVTEAFLRGKPWTTHVWHEACAELRKELSLPAGVPGGQAEFRTALASSFLFKFFVTITNNLQMRNSVSEISSSSSFPPLPPIDKRDLSAMSNFITEPKHIARGEQTYTKLKGSTDETSSSSVSSSAPSNSSVGASVMHKSARAQVTGEAIYVDDIPLPSNALHAALVTSTRAHARLLSVDTKECEACEGFVAYFSAKDVTGCNMIGAVVKDEEVFVTEFVKHYGAVIGVVVANTHEQAVFASKKVTCTYEDLPAIISIKDAITASSFFSPVHTLIDGDLEDREKKAEVVVEGDGRLGGQEHFYLETNCTLATPTEGGKGLEVYSSTQNCTKTQNFCASVCGLSAAHIVAKTKRLGGGFGGKEG